MKKKLYVLTLLFSGYLFAQQEELVNTTWYLEKLILEGEDHFLPQNEEVSQSQLYVDSSNSYFSTDVGSCAGGMSDGLSFPEANYFTIDIFYISLSSCEIEENNYFAGMYFNFIWNNNLEFPFHYVVIEEADNLKKLVITGNDTNQAVYYNASLSVQNIQELQVSIYPNPVSDVLYFDSEIEKVVFYDISGRKVLEQNQVIAIDVSHLEKGTYILKIVAEQFIQTKKIIIK
jgi:hypothetical protein